MIVQGLYDNNLYPATFGGAERIYRLYRHLAQRAEVRVLSLLKSRERAPREETADGIRIQRRKPGYPTLLYHADRLRLAPMHSTFHWHRALGSRFAEFFREPRAVYEFDSFLLTAWYDRVPRGALKVYQAVNVESDWHAAALNRFPDPARRMSEFRNIEAHAVQGADLVLYVSRADGERLVADFGARRDHMLYVPNGFEPERFAARDPGARQRARAALGLEPGDRVAVFTGSAMRHNQAAADAIVKHVAPARPDWKFLLVGDLEVAPGAPPGVRRTGRVPDVLPCLAAADVALNPVTGGSGSSLKVPEYLAAGLPLLTTAFGMRGFEELLDVVTVCEPEAMGAQLDAAVPLPADLEARLRPYAWETQAEKMFRAYEAWLEAPREAPALWASIH